MIMMKRILLAFFVLSMALSATAQDVPPHVYINPGHGDWGPLSRPMATLKYDNEKGQTVICEAGVDTLGFWESNTNLWKAFALREKLVAAGYKVTMSRTENGPYPYVYGDESIDKKLPEICAEVTYSGADYFISIHSNANVDGDFVNYPLFLYAGTDNNNENSIAMANTAWPRHFEAFGNDKDWETRTHGFEPNSHYSLKETNLRGDESFYGGSGLQVLEHSCPGYLVEGYFHTYQPARHRALNPDWCRQEGIRYFRGIQDYYDEPGEQVGYIMGCVRSLEEMSDELNDHYKLFNYMTTSYDDFLPINGAKVVLRDASGNIIRTECYRHVARHITDQYYYTTDNNYNGIFVFENLDPGKYTLTVHAAGYEDKSMTVDVEADKTVYPEIFLKPGQGTEPIIDVDVQWVLNGGKVDGTLPSTITEEYRLPIPYKAGYAFQGWNTKADGTGEYKTTLQEGYRGTLYAIWRPASVKWELNGGHVSENKLLWEDFQKTILPYEPLEPIENASEVIDYVGGEAIYNLLSNAEGGYKWLGDYLWNKAYPHVNPGSGNEYIWWGNMLNAFLNCKAYEFNCYHVENEVHKATVDFTELGKYDSWKSWATDQIRQKVTLPNQITSPYTIPTPEKEGATFQGWYDNPHGVGDPITVLEAGYEGTVYAIWVGPVPCIVAYDLNCKYKVGAMAFDFSFYANTQPASGKLIFYNKNGETEEEYILNNLRQGKNTVFMPAENIPGYVPGKDILWEVHLEARPSTLFAEIFRSDAFNTAYATIDNSPESDFFGSIWVANQQTHGYNSTADGGIWRLVPEQGYARDKDAYKDGHRPHRPRPGDNPNPNGWKPPQGGGGQPNGGGQSQPNGSGQQPPQGGKQEPPHDGRPDHTPSENPEAGFEVIFRPTVAPDGIVYLTDNGKSYGGVFIMDPHTKEITNFFDGCTYENGEWKDNNGTVVGSGSTGAHIYWTEDGNNRNGFSPMTSKLFLMHNAHSNGDSNGETRGFFVYDLNNYQSPTHTKLKHYPNQTDGMVEYNNTDITDYAIVGTSRGAWVCQLRNDKGNFISDPSLTFYPTEGEPTIFTKALDSSVGGTFEGELIHGSFGSAIAVSKDEKLLAMVGGTGNIMLFDIEWSTETTPTLTNKRDYPIVANDPLTSGTWDLPTITTLNFDYAGNLVATLGETYNDASDKHQVVIFTLPKTENYIDVPSRYSQRVPSLVEDDQCTSIAKADKKYETVEIYRNLQAGMYNTICLPFGINSLEGTPYQGASVVKFVGTEIQKVGGEDVLKLNFQELTFQDGDVMQAGEPYLIKPLRDIKEPVRVSNVSTCVNAEDIAGKSIKPANSAATFHGITSPTTIEKTPDILFLVANNRLATASSTGEMLANRAYFVLDNAQILPKRSMISIVKSTPAGFEEIYNTYQTEAYKMLYNGMIVIVRDGVMYDLMGTRIK